MATTEKFEFPWERIAANDGDMPDGLSLPDQTAFTAIRNVYRLYQWKAISAAQASAEKASIRSTWEQAKQLYDLNKKLLTQHIRLIAATEPALNACRKDPSRENALRLCDSVDGLHLPTIEQLGIDLQM